MGITSAGMQSRDGYNIGRYAKQRCRVRGTNLHQNGETG
ncbi:TPA: hypothetical protein OBQ05_000988 [Escherichia coli]|nr:hypothetical protein [Escherichia coli]HCO6997809.1 hypothetical protein [Escherichia coli]